MKLELAFARIADSVSERPVRYVSIELHPLSTIGAKRGRGRGMEEGRRGTGGVGPEGKGLEKRRRTKGCGCGWGDAKGWSTQDVRHGCRRSEIHTLVYMD